MIDLPNPAGFEGLLDLDRRGVDIRPTLLRVLTDQYLHRRTHTPAEERQFTELALRLIEETDVATRAAVAARLAPHAGAPRPIVRQLARDVLEVAEPILRLSPQLTPADLAAIAAEGGPSYAAIIARRGAPEPAPAPGASLDLLDSKHDQAASAAGSLIRGERDGVRGYELSRDPAPLTPALSPIEKESPAVPQLESVLDRKVCVSASATPAPTPVGSATQADASELAELFFAAGPVERRLILMSLDYLPGVPPELPARIGRPDIWRLESAALRHNSETLVDDLERALGVSHRYARRIVIDEMGEPIVVAAKAMEMPADVLQRVLLFMTPGVGQSVDRVYELGALCGDITVQAARRLIAIWRAADPPEAQAGRHEALWQEAVENARAALSDITRRAPARRETPAVGATERAAGTERR